MSRAEHVARAEAAYAQYRMLQERIDAFEQKVSLRYPDNDRLAASYLKNSDEPEVWVYRALCRLRDVKEQVLKTEATMAGLYKGEQGEQ